MEPKNQKQSQCVRNQYRRSFVGFDWALSRMRPSALKYPETNELSRRRAERCGLAEMSVRRAGNTYPRSCSRRSRG
jgi:hypothetical protein